MINLLDISTKASKPATNQSDPQRTSPYTPELEMSGRTATPLEMKCIKQFTKDITLNSNSNNHKDNIIITIINYCRLTLPSYVLVQNIESALLLMIVVAC